MSADPHVAAIAAAVKEANNLSGEDRATRRFGQVEVVVTVKPILGVPAPWADAVAIASAAIAYARAEFNEEQES